MKILMSNQRLHCPLPKFDALFVAFGESAGGVRHRGQEDRREGEGRDRFVDMQEDALLKYVLFLCNLGY